MTWLCNPLDTSVHVTPVDDLRDHVEAPDCWCKPTQDAEEPGLWIHHAMDGREAFETEERKPS